MAQNGVPAKTNYTAELASFTSKLKYEDIPAHVIARTEDLVADWIFCAVAGAKYKTPVAFEKFAREQGGGGKGGECELVTLGEGLSSYWASFVNAAAGHVVEQDDVYGYELAFFFFSPPSPKYAC
jgi:2-methylcitrate dehydratase PrpD